MIRTALLAENGGAFEETAAAPPPPPPLLRPLTAPPKKGAVEDRADGAKKKDIMWRLADGSESFAGGEGW